MDFNKKINQDNRGFTLVELIITVVILALVTAPFLSSFVTASNTNVKSKRVQEANELSQYIIEQFKAKTVKKLLEDNSWLTENKNPTGEVVNYTGTLTGTNLPTGYAGDYSAEITMTPSTSVINQNVTPVLEKLNQNQCAIFMEYICGWDSYCASTATSRQIKVDVDYDASAEKKYSVTLHVDYRNAVSSVASREKKVMYEKLPAVYIFYKPFSVSDTIVVNNNLNESQLGDASGNVSKLNTYIIKQDGFGTSLLTDNITFKEYDSSIPVTLKTLMDKTKSVKYTTIYTNIGVTATSDDGSLNTVLKTVKIDSLYDMEVIIKYAGKEISTFTATKNTVG